MIVFLSFLFVVPSSLGASIRYDQGQKIDAKQRYHSLKYLHMVQAEEASKVKKHILIFAPHPDDEILCCTSVIREAVAQKLPIKIIYITDGEALALGDPNSSIAYGKIRQRESTLATQKLGVAAEDLLWLGFPDGGLSELDPVKVLRSPYTDATRTGFKNYVPKFEYTQKNLMSLMQKIIKDYPPSKVYIPDEDKEKHPDHVQAGKLLTHVFSIQGQEVPVFHYTIHDPSFQKSTNFFDLEKARLIRLFKSQYHDLAHANFLDRYAYRREIFQ